MSRVIAATIRHGQAVADELATLPDGTAVEVVAANDDLELSAADRAELERSNAEVDRGDFVPADEVLTRLGTRAESRSGRG